MPATPTVFISYNHLDEAWKDRLVPQLRALGEARGRICAWPLEEDHLDLAADFSGFYGAKMGQLELKLAIAPNDITGLWQIRVRESASGLRDDPYLACQKLVRIDSACSTVESRDTLGTRL